MTRSYTEARVFITGIGIISPLGQGFYKTRDSIINKARGIKPITLFEIPHDAPLPVGEINEPLNINNVPRTHALALIAAQEAIKDSQDAPDAIVLGVSTGGMPVSEMLLKEENKESELYRYHSTGSVAEYIASHTGCRGPVITISTACSSGTVALKIAFELIRCGIAKQVLAGGADALCRLTYYGFNSLQLLDPTGAHPLDKDRRGMSVAEGSAMFLLTASEHAPKNAFAELLGAGLSCDAYHPASPHPDGAGALKAMQNAIQDARISLSDIDYINLHGTGTKDNDLSEAKALHSLFGEDIPPVSSTKGAFGHSLAAAGAIESVVSAISITENIIPANIGCENPDPDLKLKPVLQQKKAEVNTVLSNSFGFGGNNACLVISSPKNIANEITPRKPCKLAILGSACITGAGNTYDTIESLITGKECRGVLDLATVSGNLSLKDVRRLKRLPRITLSLSQNACDSSGSSEGPSSIFFGTGWGALSETSDFLSKLFESGEQFTSPTDFIGSVHNAPAGQAAIRFNSTGANITTTGGNYSFEQALLCASLISHNNDDPLMVIGADEHHEKLSGIFDPSVDAVKFAADGGGALLLKPTDRKSGLTISTEFFEYSNNNENIINSLVKSLGGAERINDIIGAIFLGMPRSEKKITEIQYNQFLSITGFKDPIIDYREYLGEFATSSAVASVVAIQFIQRGEIPMHLCKNKTLRLGNKGILILGLGNFVTAIKVLK
ncbi:MAG: beta-ketoacyl-[acyl-carrier-protein] synthase family protein [Spirochaetota bacterium]|nr:beta-ketoacyl-[acyl-carrier-protein] synthase family protein [Spirochaetota bacterium]